MTIVEAAAKLGRSPKTIAVQIRLGKIRAVKHGRDWWIEDAEVEHYRKNHLR